MAIVKQSTAYTRMFKMIDSADHISKKTGLTCTVNLSKAGGAFGAAGGTITEVANGWYKIALTTTDTNTLGDLAYYITATGADDTDFSDQVSVRLIDDAAFPATSGRSMVVDASGLVDANAVKIGPTGSGTAQTARDVGASVLLSSGTGAGQLSLSSGTVTVGTNNDKTGYTASTVSDKTGYSIGVGGIITTSFAANALTSATVNQNFLDLTWSSATRTLTTVFPLKKNTARAGFQFFMVDSSDHFTPKTGLTITATRSIDGAAFGACANSATEISNGWYTIDLAAADLNGNNIALKFSSAGADQRNLLVVTNV